MPCFPCGVACLRVQTNFDCALLHHRCDLRKARESHVCTRIARLYLTNHNRPNSTATPVGLRAWRSSKKVSILEGETGLPPARKTLPTRYGSCKSHTYPRYLRMRGERKLCRNRIEFSIFLCVFCKTFVPLSDSSVTSTNFVPVPTRGLCPFVELPGKVK